MVLPGARGVSKLTPGGTMPIVSGDMKASSASSADPMRGRLFGGVIAVAALFALGAAGIALAFTPSRPPPPIPGQTVAASARCPSTTARRRAVAATTRAGNLHPILAVVGASFSAGVGAQASAKAWPADLGRMLHMRVEVSADPGAGFISPGRGHRGPFAKLTGQLKLAELRPAVVVIQGGHNDIGRPAPALSRNVRQLVNSIRCQTPGTRVAILSVFPTGNVPSHAAVLTDRVIVAAARQADPQVIVLDPITQHWHFARGRDQLHPTVAGHQWIAAKVAAALRAAGAVPARPIAKPTASA
jgi:acyl-CoA thioesterase-1